MTIISKTHLRVPMVKPADQKKHMHIYIYIYIYIYRERERERESHLKSQVLSERRFLTKKKASTTIEDLINIHYIEKHPSKTCVPTSLPKQMSCNQTIVRNSPNKFSNYSPKTTS
jgi:hypothetical protein